MLHYQNHAKGGWPVIKTINQHGFRAAWHKWIVILDKAGLNEVTVMTRTKMIMAGAPQPSQFSKHMSDRFLTAPQATRTIHTQEMHALVVSANKFTAPAHSTSERWHCVSLAHLNVPVVRSPWCVSSLRAAGLSKHLRAWARLSAQSLRYEAVLEMQPRQYSMEWIAWVINISPKLNCERDPTNTG